MTIACEYYLWQRSNKPIKLMSNKCYLFMLSGLGGGYHRTLTNGKGVKIVTFLDNNQ